MARLDDVSPGPSSPRAAMDMLQQMATPERPSSGPAVTPHLCKAGKRVLTKLPRIGDGPVRLGFLSPEQHATPPRPTVGSPIESPGPCGTSKGRQLTELPYVPSEQPMGLYMSPQDQVIQAAIAEEVCGLHPQVRGALIRDNIIDKLLLGSPEPVNRQSDVAEEAVVQQLRIICPHISELAIRRCVSLHPDISADKVDEQRRRHEEQPEQLQQGNEASTGLEQEHDDDYENGDDDHGGDNLEQVYVMDSASSTMEQSLGGLTVSKKVGVQQEPVRSIGQQQPVYTILTPHQYRQRFDPSQALTNQIYLPPSGQHEQETDHPREQTTQLYPYRNISQQAHEQQNDLAHAQLARAEMNLRLHQGFPRIIHPADWAAAHVEVRRAEVNLQALQANEILQLRRARTEAEAKAEVLQQELDEVREAREQEEIQAAVTQVKITQLLEMNGRLFLQNYRLTQEAAGAEGQGVDMVVLVEKTILREQELAEARHSLEALSCEGDEELVLLGPNDVGG